MKKFLRKNITNIVLAAVATIVVIVIYNAAHNVATAQRGYQAVGGEIFLLVIPYLIYVANKNIKDNKKAYKRNLK